jgi:DNA-binding MarR family transcriptional regulator
MSPPKPAAAKDQALLRIERELGVLIHRVRRRTAVSAASVHPELQPAALPVLAFVVDHEPVRASDVVEHFGIDKGAVSRHVAHLESLGLLTRACDPEDRRAQTIVPTAFGRRRLEALRAARREVVADRLAHWTAADLLTLADGLGRYNASIENPDEAE